MICMAATLDQRIEEPSPQAKTTGAFTEAEYSANAGKVIAHAAATGIAVVARPDGRPRVVISIPTVDLPTLVG
jgi:hypothetical protein